MCGHTSIIALFRFELLNNFSIHVELRISKYLPTSYISRTNDYPGKSHIDNSPILPTLTVSWSVMAHAGICQHGRANHLPTTCASTLGRSIHTNIIIIHIVQTSAPLIPKSKMIDSVKMATLSLSRRLGGPGLTPRTSARTLVEARRKNGFTCVNLPLMLQMLTLSDPFLL